VREAITAPALWQADIVRVLSERDKQEGRGN
jgi:hypothetical protein